MIPFNPYAYFAMIVFGAIVVACITWMRNRKYGERYGKKVILREVKAWLGFYSIISIAWTIIVFAFLIEYK